MSASVKLYAWVMGALVVLVGVNFFSHDLPLSLPIIAYLTI